MDVKERERETSVTYQRHSHMWWDCLKQLGGGEFSLFAPKKEKCS